MMDTIKSPVTAENGPGLKKQSSSHHTTVRPLKWRRVLAALALGKSYTRFQAERELSDHTLPSTVAGLQAKGVTINRRNVIVPGYHGSPTHCCEYWLAPESLDRALQLLGRST